MPQGLNRIKGAYPPILTISQGIAVMTHIFVCVYHDVYGMTVTNRKH